MFQYLNWALDLVGVSPIARLLAFRMASNASFTGVDMPDGPVCEIDLAETLTWIGCDDDDLTPVVEELRARGVNPLRVEDGKVRYTLPQLDDAEDARPKKPKPDHTIWIYVIRASNGVSKIGISRLPDYRLAGLQAANSLQELTMEWRCQGPASLIRKVERAVHETLAPWARGNEWFNIQPSTAIEVVKEELARRGLTV